MKEVRERLLKFIQEKRPLGGCRCISLGHKCECPQCDYDKIIAALDWYGCEAKAIAKHFDKNPEAVLASVTVLKLDAGKRSKI